MSRPFETYLKPFSMLLNFPLFPQKFGITLDFLFFVKKNIPIFSSAVEWPSVDVGWLLKLFRAICNNPRGLVLTGVEVDSILIGS